ncbi:MAG: hypothetical protein ACLGH3_04675 [Actinomycetota bacterium]
MAHKTVSKVIAALFAAVLVPGLLPQVSQAAENQMRFAGTWKYSEPEGTQTSPAIPAGALILNPPARTAYQFFPLEGIDTLIRIVDLDTFRIRHEVLLQVPLFTNRGAGIIEYIHALDEDENILYLPYIERSLFFGGLVAIDGGTGAVIRTMDRLEANDPTAAVEIRDDSPDGPEDVGVCTSAACLPQTIGAAPTPVAMEFVPSYISGSRSKILMLWTEPMAPGLEGNLYVSWATQWDAETGRQDFNYRIQSCTVKYPLDTQSRYPLTIFQARLGAGIYLGCHAQGQTGQVVRIRLDQNGQPSGEDAYPGPQSVVDVLADRMTDRLAFRISNPAGETYWVFSGESSNYTGIVAATLAQIPTVSGIDQTSGRLYVMAAATERGSQKQPAALVATDMRRAPVPQMTRYEDVFVPNADLALAVDTAHPSGFPRIFVHASETTEYKIIEDRVPISEDAELTDLDRFTTDVKEQEGVTSANFTGTGHAYGVRTLMAGGVLGAVPIGVNVSGATLRVVANYSQSPCSTPDREFALGSIPFASLATNLTSAEAAAATTDSGTIADVREPSGRCHPYPLPAALDEPPRFLPEDEDRDGQSQGDEILGTEWPFFKAQCSGEGTDEKTTTLRPADRDPVPAQTGVGGQDQTQTGTELDPVLASPRDTSQPLEDNNAKVHCGQLESRVDADAVAGALIVDDLPPGVDSLEVGSVGSFTRLYRDEDRGLVAQTVAYARDIAIGDRISIDIAYSKAEAWAAGRPGTAGTSLERRVCGVSIPEISGRYSVIPIDSPAGDLPPDPDPVEVGDPLYDATQGIQNPVDGGDGISYPIGTVDPLNYGDDDQNIDGAIKACSETPEQASAANGTPLGSRPFLEIMNRVLGARGKASIPEPDRELRQGSPGGYLASIQKDRFQQIGSRSVSNDGSTQVPAFEIQFYGDDPTLGRGRQLFQFAGVDASVTYGIFLLNPNFPETPTDTFGDDLPPWDMTDDLISITGGPDLPPTFEEPAPPSPPTTIVTPITYIFRGAVFLSRSWQDAGLAASVLLLLVGPAVLLGRRRGLRSLT